MWFGAGPVLHAEFVRIAMGEAGRVGHAVAPLVALGAVCIIAFSHWFRSQTAGIMQSKRGKSHLSRLGLRGTNLTPAEKKLVTHIMDPETVQKVREEDIIGQEHVVKQLRRTINISLRGAGRGSVLSQGRGFLLSGPPGTGKTTIAEVRTHAWGPRRSGSLEAAHARRTAIPPKTRWSVHH